MPWCASLSSGVFCLGSRRACSTASVRSPGTSTAGLIVGSIRFVGIEGTEMLRIAVKL